MQAHHKANGGFQNLSYTPQLAPGYSMPKIMLQFLKKPASVSPPLPIPTVSTNLRNYYSDQLSVTWFGHSSYLVHYRGFNILVDPVFSGYASPFSFSIKAFKGADRYKPADMPVIDLLLITHNHYDHLDSSTIKALDGKIKKVVTTLGVGKQIRHLLSRQQEIIEMDWWQQQQLGENIFLTATPSRHFSGRGLKRNGTLWASFALQVNHQSVFIGSDSGYDSHFKMIGDRLGPFDLAMLECGQYNEAWPYIHSMPESLVQEANELRAAMVFPVHWAKFSLALHPWDEPINRFTAAAEKSGLTYTTPMIGEPLVLGEELPKKRWWNID